jgi:microcompartment protein CcmK/EutM
MRIGKVIGRVTHSVVYPTLTGGRFVILEVQDRFSLAGRPRKTGSDAVIAYDHLGAGVGDTVAFTESREACMPFYPEKVVPLDAYVAAILDAVVIEVEPDPTKAASR